MLNIFLLFNFLFCLLCTCHLLSTHHLPSCSSFLYPLFLLSFVMTRTPTPTPTSLFIFLLQLFSQLLSLLLSNHDLLLNFFLCIRLWKRFWLINVMTQTPQHAAIQLPQLLPLSQLLHPQPLLQATHLLLVLPRHHKKWQHQHR